MVLGIGTDIVEISRMEKVCASCGFLERWFTLEENRLVAYKGIKTAAGNFACKESAAKALGTGFSGFTPYDIEILRDSLGKPVINLYNGALERFNEIGASSIHVSVSHCEEYASAVVIIES